MARLAASGGSRGREIWRERLTFEGMHKISPAGFRKVYLENVPEALTVGGKTIIMASERVK